MKKKLCLILYYVSFYLPDSYTPVVGKLCNSIRVSLIKNIIKKAGKIITVNRKAYIGNARDMEIGDYSGIGANCILPSNLKMGSYIMMAPDVHILAANHNFDRLDIPMGLQGNSQKAVTVIDDDVWIGTHVIMTPGRHIKKGSIIAAGTVLTKDFPEYSIVGGNPSRLIRSRLPQQENTK